MKKIDDNIYHIIEEIESNKARIGISVKFKNEAVFSFHENDIFDSACSIMAFILLEYEKRKSSGLITGDELLNYTADNYATGAGVIKFLPINSELKLKDCVELMIEKSDHIAANMVIDFLTIESINKTIQDFGYKNTILKKKFLIPKVKNVGATTPREYATFYSNLEENTLFPEIVCKELKDIFLKQTYKDIIAGHLLVQDDYLDVACKSGKADGKIYDDTTDSYIVDGGIVFTKKGNYTIAILGELSYDSNMDLNQMKAKMQTISTLIFDMFVEAKNNETNLCPTCGSL